MDLPQSIIDLIASGAPAHMVTLNPDGSPHLTLAWVGIEDGEPVMGHLPKNKKVRNILGDPRVVLSLQSPSKSAIGLTEYAVIYGTARITEGGAAELLQRLAHVYLGGGVKFPPMDDPPAGYVTRIRVDRIDGVGPWTGRVV